MRFMKRCRNCWTDNPDSAEHCKKCGKPLDESWLHNKNFRVCWEAVAGGLITAAVLFVICYSLYGASNTFAFGMIPIPFIAGCVTTIIAYRKETDTSNSILNALFTGFLIGCGFVIIIFSLAASMDTSAPPALIFIYIPALAAWTLVGGVLGSIINVAVENGKKSTIIIATIIIAAVALIGYGIHEFEVSSSYDNGAYVSANFLDYLDIIQSDADTYLNASYITPEERLSNLKNAEVKYDRMVNITNAAKPQVDEMRGNSSSDAEEEYAQAMETYLQLKHDYCTEMYLGIQSEINGNTKDAEKHYQNAQNLTPKIQDQNNQITQTINKDQTFKQYITGIINKAQNDVGMHKSENMTFYLG